MKKEKMQMKQMKQMKHQFSLTVLRPHRCPQLLLPTRSCEGSHIYHRTGMILRMADHFSCTGSDQLCSL